MCRSRRRLERFGSNNSNSLVLHKFRLFSAATTRIERRLYYRRLQNFCRQRRLLQIEFVLWGVSYCWNAGLSMPPLKRVSSVVLL